MSWIYEKSSLWRRIVAVTKQSPLAMVGFTTAVCAGSWYAGKAVMQVSLTVKHMMGRQRHDEMQQLGGRSHATASDLQDKV